MEEKKARFLESLKAAGGIIYAACENCGISRSTYYRWRAEDPDFMQGVEEVMEAQIDFVESKLMGLIRSGDTTATIFYLKTKGRKRGYSEKVPVPGAEAQAATSRAALPAADSESREAVEKRARNKKDYIIKLLKRQGKYTPELSLQAGLAARLLVHADMLAVELFGSGYRPVNVEISREGNERQIVNPLEKAYLDAVRESQRALRALGMNTDAKERKAEDDSFNEFMRAFREGEE